MLECRCGTVAVPMNGKIPRGWTTRNQGREHLCPLCSRVHQEAREREEHLH